MSLRNLQDDEEEGSPMPVGVNQQKADLPSAGWENRKVSGSLPDVLITLAPIYS